MDWYVPDNKLNYIHMVESFLDNCIFCDYAVKQRDKNSYFIYIEDYLMEKQADRLYKLMVKIFDDEVIVSNFYWLFTNFKFAPPVFIDSVYQLNSLKYCIIGGNKLDLRKIRLSEDFNILKLDICLKDYGLKKIEYIDLTGLDTSNLKILSFSGCQNLKEIYGISDIDTGNIVDMSFMFNDCKSLESLDLRKWDVSRVKSMKQMFNNC